MIQQLQPASWMQQMLFVDLLLAFAAAVGVLLCLRALYVLERQNRKQRAESGQRETATPVHRPPSALRSRADQGVATIEFALVMPVVLFLILVLVQTMLLMAGQLFVHYAAYAAVRSAIVQIPNDLSQRGEPINVISVGASNGKYAAIEQAAILAVMPVCGRDDSSRVDGEGFASALRQHYELLGETTPRWVNTLAAERYCYAAEHTQIELIALLVDEDGRYTSTATLTSGKHTFGMKEAVAVRVEHRFNLSVPYVRAIFADAKMPTKYGDTAYTEVRALQMLTLEGIKPDIVVVPERPIPTLPRLDQRNR